MEHIKNKINASDVFSEFMVSWSPRMIGDAIEEIIKDIFKNNLPAEIGNPINEKFARRAMADLAYNGVGGEYIIVDVKTHNEETDFNMPNLTSVKRLADLYTDDENYFSVMVVNYILANNKPQVTNIIFEPIEHFKWDCLTIGALGWGQIQIANSNKINIDSDKSRKDWMLDFLDNIEIFYPKEILKINERIEYFNKLRKVWSNK